MWLFCCFSCYLCAQIDSSDTGHWQQAPTYYNPTLPLANPQKVYKLYFDDLNTDPDSVWLELAKCVNLKQLTLEGDFFHEIPNELLLVSANIEELYLVSNQGIAWDDFWEKIPQFKRLQSLHINRCDFGAALPKGFSRLNKTKVKHLDLSNSTFQDNFPPDFFQLKRLETLNLSSCGLSVLPPEICRLKNLQVLDLGIHPEGVPNSITALPDNFYRLSQLQNLRLDQNPIKKLPDNFTKLRNFETLSLSACERLEASQTFRQLTEIKSLISLNISNLSLRALGGEIKNWVNLRSLDISGCGLNHLPNSLLKLPLLETVNLENNSFPPEELARYKLIFKQDLD